MSYQLYPSDLTDTQWQYIKELIPAAQPAGRPRTLDMRLVVNAILYVVVGGIQWRMLPQEYPTWPSVYHYFAKWCDDGTWHRIHDTVRAQVRRRAGRHKHATAGCLDSQTVKRTARPGVRGFDAGKQCAGRKRHILVDTLGLLLVVVVTATSVQDRDEGRGKPCGACGSMGRIADSSLTGRGATGTSPYRWCAGLMRNVGLSSCRAGGWWSGRLPGLVRPVG